MGERTALTLMGGLVALTACWWSRHPTPVDRLEITPTTPYRIDLNTADAAELRLLPGVGEAMAQRILEDRQRNGPFLDADDFRRVRGVGPRLSQNARPYIYFGESDLTTAAAIPSSAPPDPALR